MVYKDCGFEAFTITVQEGPNEGETIVFSNDPYKKISPVPDVGICYSEREDGVRTVYCNNPDDLKDIASKMEQGLGFRKARSESGYAGRFKEVSGSYVGDVLIPDEDDASNLSDLVNSGLSIDDALAEMGFEPYGWSMTTDGYILQALSRSEEYSIAICPPDETSWSGEKRLSVRRRDGEPIDMNDVFNYVHQVFKGNKTI